MKVFTRDSVHLWPTTCGVNQAAFLSRYKYFLDGRYDCDYDYVYHFIILR